MRAWEEPRLLSGNTDLVRRPWGITLPKPHLPVSWTLIHNKRREDMGLP